VTADRPLVEVLRGALREGAHYGSAVLVDPAGRVVRAVGDCEAPMYPRSSTKPAQAIGMLRSGLDVSGADLAMVAASHNGEPEHVERVRAMLARAGLGESALRCPADWPMSSAARDRVVAAGGGRERLAMNCSGKHAGMLATCAINSWSTEDYLDPGHPLQLALAEAISELAGEEISNSTVDGCGAPLHALPLTGLARIFSRVAGGRGELQQVADAMREHPWCVGGTGREDTLLMRAVPGLVSKMGAEGVIALGLPDGRAAAVKISDGASRARVPAAVAALRALAADELPGADREALDALAEEPVLGGGQPVGTVRALPHLFT
jgi:L-asparaginase II